VAQNRITAAFESARTEVDWVAHRRSALQAFVAAATAASTPVALAEFVRAARLIVSSISLRTVDLKRLK
jgi:hypothetical protein